MLDRALSQGSLTANVRRRNSHPRQRAVAYLDARPLRSAARIVIVGDSIAYGRCDPQGGWAAQLATAHIGANETQHRVVRGAADARPMTP